MPTFTITIDGPIGSNVNGVFYPFDVSKMSNEALAHVFEYGAQRIVNDKCGGKDKTDADKAKLATETVARLAATPYVRRASAGEGDPLAFYIRQWFRDAFKADPSTDAAKAFKAAKGDDRNALLEATFDKQTSDAQAAIRAAASVARDRDIAARKATLEGVTAAMKGLSLKL